VARGFTAVKMNGTEEMQIVDTHDKVTRVLENVQAVRDAVGPDIGLAVDFHGRVHKPMAKVLMRELTPFGLMFIEEPVLSEHLEAIPELAALSPAPIALGERLYSRFDFKRVLQTGGVDILQPDPSHSGGITETRKIAAMAEAYDVAIALHCPLGPIALAANLQLDAVCYNAFIQEQSLGIHYNASNDLWITWWTARRSTTRRASSGFRMAPGWASRSTRPTWTNAPPKDTAGATPSGAMPMAAWPSGDPDDPLPQSQRSRGADHRRRYRYRRRLR